jgi:predicted dienelactone hydrolase
MWVSIFPTQLNGMTDFTDKPFRAIRRRLIAACGASALVFRVSAASTQALNLPLTQSDNVRLPDLDTELVVDSKIKRKIKLKIRLPAQEKPTALILYSPGLGSGVSNGADWCEAWRAAGYLVATLAHPVTDDSIWNTSKSRSLKVTIAEAIASPQYALRVKDCSAALDYLLSLPALKPYLEKADDGKGGVHRPRIGIAGHSYGALTVQSIAGQGQGGKGPLDPRIDAAIALSPSAMSQERAAAMGQVKIPFFCVTGDLDGYVTFKKDADSVRLGVPLSQRQWVYDHLPKGKRQELLVAQADHMTFSGEPIEAEHFSRDVSLPEQNNPKTWARVSALTTGFWDFYLKSEAKPSAEQRKAYIKRMQALAGPQDQLKFD